MKKEKTIVNALHCPVCDDVIFSRARHDYHSCTCGAITIDGGFDYLRCGWDPNVMNGKKPMDLELAIPKTKSELYRDWNYSDNKFGTHKWVDVLKWIHTK